jgi:hypothetical protein
MLWLSIFINLLEKKRILMSLDESEKHLKVICYDEAKIREVLSIYYELDGDSFPVKVHLYCCRTRETLTP